MVQIIGGVTGFLIGSMQSLWSGMPFQRLRISFLKLLLVDVDGTFKQSLKTIMKPTVFIQIYHVLINRYYLDVQVLLLMQLIVF